MKTSINTILITGGSAGIGLEMAKQFIAWGNQVIITGRNEEKLKKAAVALGHITAIQCDITKAQDVDRLVARLEVEFPHLNVLINNAGSAHTHNLAQSKNAYDLAAQEVETNYLSVVRLTERLLPLLQRNEESAIVNVSSVVAFASAIAVPTYSASKAALHSYSQSLRLSLRASGIKVFELMPPLVDTELSASIGGAKGIKPSIVAQELVSAMAEDTYEIHVGDTAKIYHLMKKSPQDAFLAMNGVLV